MKKNDVEKRLRGFGWYLLRRGGKHDVWTNGELETTVPRHREINEITAQAIIRIAKENPK